MTLYYSDIAPIAKNLETANVYLSALAAAAALPTVERELNRLESKLSGLYFMDGDGNFPDPPQERVRNLELRIEVLEKRRADYLQTLTGVRP